MAKRKKTVFVTGAAGFIGAALVIRLLNTYENIRIVGMDDLNPYYDVKLKKYRLDQITNAVKKNPLAQWVFIRDTITDKEAVMRLFHEYRPDIVVNLAAQAGVRYSLTHPDVYMETNIGGFYNILEACRAYPVAHLIYASSSSVYGDNTQIPYSTEDKTDHPVSLYAATKKADELIAYAYSRLYAIPATGLRFFTVYGPAGRPDMAYFSFAEKMLEGREIELFNYGNCRRDFTYIDDIVRGIVLVMEKPPASRINEERHRGAPHAVYNIGNNHPENLKDFVVVLKEELVKAGVLPKLYDLEEHVTLRPMQPGDVEITYADIMPFERDFGFRPKTSLREGLHLFAKWYGTYKQVKE